MESFTLADLRRDFVARSLHIGCWEACNIRPVPAGRCEPAVSCWENLLPAKAAADLVIKAFGAKRLLKAATGPGRGGRGHNADVGFTSSTDDELTLFAAAYVHITTMNFEGVEWNKAELGDVH